MADKLGDTHNGRATERVCENGVSVIRKYRSAATERAFAAFLEELAALGMQDLPACAQVLNETATYHDEAVAEHLPVQSEQALVQCFRREGTLLFLSYLLGAIDLHAENIIISGDMPIVIDLETLLTGEVARQRKTEGSLTGTILRTHLLANYLTTEQGVCDCSGFGGVIAQGKNLPLYLSAAAYPWQYGAALAQGFGAAYDTALDNRKAIAPLFSLFADCRFRQLLRPTQTYGTMLDVLAVLPAQKREAAAISMLSRAYLNDTDPQRAAQTERLLRAEVDALLRGDVPLFTCRGNGVDLYDADNCVLSSYLCRSPVNYAENQLSRLCDSDKNQQLQLLTLTLRASTPLSKTAPRGGTAAARLERCRVSGLKSGWTMLDTDRHGSVFFQSAGFGLYDGLCGILCAYAACGSDKLEQYYEPFRTMLHANNREIALTDRTLSLQDGVGGQLSALLHIAELTGKGCYADDAAYLAAQLAQQADGTLSADVLSGAAGLAPALPKLPRKLALPLAQALEAPLAAAKLSLTGAAHGAAGLALALGALQAVFADERFNDKILALLQWEDTHFDEEAQNWADLRDPARHGFMSGWCSGAPGIGMTRKRVLEYTQSGAIRALCERDIKRAQEFLLRRTPSKRDCLCCGAAARLMAASMLGVKLPGAAAALAEDTASPRLLHPLDTADDNCGLMQGLAGICYARATEGNPRSGGMLL